MPIFMGLFLYINFEKLKEEKYKEKYKKMYVDIAFRRKDKLSVLYLPFFFLRRWTLLLSPMLVLDDDGI